MYKEIWLELIGGIAISLFAVLGLCRVSLEMQFPGKLAKIEQLREDILRVPHGANEDAMGQVTEWNQEIKAAKRYRAIWWGRLCIPEEWENVKVIKINEENSNATR